MEQHDISILDVTLPLLPELLIKLIPIIVILVFSIINFNRNKKWYTLFQVNGAILVLIYNGSFFSGLLFDAIMSSYLAVLYIKFLRLVNNVWFPLFGWSLFAVGYAKMILEVNKTKQKEMDNEK
jgi:hypothetical protein